MTDTSVDVGQQLASISDAAVGLLRDFTGRGATQARTTLRDDTVLVMMSDTLTRAERSLIDNGKADVVLEVRRVFQATMRDDLVTAVESRLYRKVIAFMSANHVDPDLAVEIFVLERQGE